jgi:hypothetical protein
LASLQGGGGNQSGGINEDDALQAHQQVYNQGGAGGVSSNTIGTAAALQALKGMVSGGGSGTTPGPFLTISLMFSLMFFPSVPWHCVYVLPVASWLLFCL